MVRGRYTHHRIPLCTFEFLCPMYILLIFKTFLMCTESHSVAHMIRKKPTQTTCMKRIHSLHMMFKNLLRRIPFNRVVRQKLHTRFFSQILRHNISKTQQYCNFLYSYYLSFITHFF